MERRDVIKGMAIAAVAPVQTVLSATNGPTVTVIPLIENEAEKNRIAAIAQSWMTDHKLFEWNEWTRFIPRWRDKRVDSYGVAIKIRDLDLRTCDHKLERVTINPKNSTLEIIPWRKNPVQGKRNLRGYGEPVILPLSSTQVSRLSQDEDFSTAPFLTFRCSHCGQIGILDGDDAQVYRNSVSMDSSFNQFKGHDELELYKDSIGALLESVPAHQKKYLA